MTEPEQPLYVDVNGKIVLPDPLRPGHFVNATPEAAAAIAALTATVGGLEKKLDRRIEMHECAMSERDDATLYADEQKARAETAEAEAATLRDRLARMEGALHTIDAHDPETGIGSCSESALRGLVLRMGEIARAALTDGGTE